MDTDKRGDRQTNWEIHYRSRYISPGILISDGSILFRRHCFNLL